MMTRTLALILIPILLSAQAPPGWAQGVSGEWSAVSAIPTGSELAVETKDGATVKGRLTAVSDSTLTLLRKKKSTDLSRNDIHKVYRVRSGSGAKSTLIGAAVGAAAGAALGGAASNSGDITLAITVPAFMGVGAGIGALIGLATGKRQKRVLLYESR
jgi:hypothetical protein